MSVVQHIMQAVVLRRKQIVRQYGGHFR